MAERPMTWKKMSAISQASRNPDKMSVTMVRSYHQQDEDETEVEADSITKGYNLFNKNLVIMLSSSQTRLCFIYNKTTCFDGLSNNISLYQCVCFSVTVFGCSIVSPGKV